MSASHEREIASAKKAKSDAVIEACYARAIEVNEHRLKMAIENLDVTNRQLHNLQTKMLDVYNLYKHFGVMRRKYIYVTWKIYTINLTFHRLSLWGKR